MNESFGEKLRRCSPQEIFQIELSAGTTHFPVMMAVDNELQATTINRHGISSSAGMALSALSHSSIERRPSDSKGRGRPMADQDYIFRCWNIISHAFAIPETTTTQWAGLVFSTAPVATPHIRLLSLFSCGRARVPLHRRRSSRPCPRRP